MVTLPHEKILTMKIEEIKLTCRDDIFFKLPLARNLLLGKAEGRSLELYLDHLSRWNGFNESSPRKSGPTDFLRAFRELAGFARQKNHPAFAEPINLSVDGVPLNGSHRMALVIACEQLGLPVPELRFVTTESTNPPWNLRYFVEVGVTPSNVRLALLERMRALPASLLVIWPRAQAFREHVLQKFSVFSDSGIAFDLSLGPSETAGLVLTTYLDEEWSHNDSSNHGKVLEAGREGRVTVLPLHTEDQVALHRVKQLSRDMWDHEFQGIHTTDSKKEALRLASVVSHQPSVELLGYIDMSHAGAFKRRVIDPLEEAGLLAPGEVCISGSQILGVLGLRKPKDVDYLGSAEFDLKTWSKHEDHIESVGINLDDFLRREENWVFVFGVKVLSLRGYQELASKRGELKDLEAVKLIRTHPLSWKSLKSYAVPSGPKQSGKLRSLGPLQLGQESPSPTKLLLLYWAVSRVRLGRRRLMGRFRALRKMAKNR